MGWLGWTEDNVLDTTMPAMEQAIICHVEMLRETTGRPVRMPRIVTDADLAKKSQPMTMLLLDAMFGGGEIDV